MKLKKFLALACAAATIGFATTGCSDEDEVISPFDVITFENASLNADGILRTGTTVKEDNIGGSFYEAYSETGIIFRSYENPDFMFWCGFEISNHHDMSTAGYTNDASAYHQNGHSGSKFAVCYDGGSSYMGPGYESEFYVADSTNKVFDHVYVTNSTYAALEMKNGGYGKQFTHADGDWFKLTVKGFDSSGTEKGSVEFYLADFRTAGSVGIITEWTKVDLQPLGAVQKLQFSFSSSDNSDWGMNTPAYCCIDDLAVRK
jgi:hypothetical protein